jgi:hypothetical protein
MPGPDPDQDPDCLHQALTSALEAGDFETVQRLSVALGTAIRLELAVAAPAERVALFTQQLARLQEHLNLARVLRAHLASQVQSNTAACLYQTASGRPHSWRFDA